MAGIVETVIRPSAVLPVAAAARIVAALREADVGRGGLWNATSSVWQRYDQPWDADGGRGGARVIGSIAVVYDQPRRNEITIYKVTIAPPGVTAGWTAAKLCDEALWYAGITLETCPRADLKPPPVPDPFRRHVEVPEQRSVWRADVGELLRSDVRELFGNRR
ncbi:MAG TPA: hypothetical protein VNA12_04955 [Mycobacteriales bacterium]|nr:hypothetical protein [Mycobacteriales bacterium]